MTVGQTVDLLVTIIIGALIGLIGYLVRERLDAAAREIGELRNEVRTLRDASTLNTIAIERLVVSQKNMVQNQTALSRAHERLIDESDDLEDVNDQLQDATSNLRRRMDAHDEYHRRLTENREERARG